MIFDPMDLPHLAVNSLSLIVPLITVHFIAGRKLFKVSINKRLSCKAIVKLDAIYYAGVTSMVGFWLLIADVETPFSAWLAFASSYLVVVAFEPVVTILTVKVLKRYEDTAIVNKLSIVKALKLSS
ncbi:MAG: energy-coupling factor ABC transporter permease, partial [Proteobacteria bacterium]|nr:energy-coupling factor ABC transporter permease [Pseudomonadota bacterium]